MICSGVLPGLQFRFAELLSQPADEALRDDPVYAGFVLSDWRADRERAERLAARLRAMGLDPDDTDAS